MAARHPIIVGQKIGRWTVLTVPPAPIRQQKCDCACDCGTRKQVRYSNLARQVTLSCGCYSREVAAARERRHGEGNTRRGVSAEYRTWQHMLRRCYTQSVPEYSNYGGRGIAVCDRWRDSYESFLADMGRRPSPAHSIDRIDVNGHYEPGNCRWATLVEQANNKRSNILVTAFGETHSVAVWARRTGILEGTLRARIVHYGWPPETALTVPLRKQRNNATLRTWLAPQE